MAHRFGVTIDCGDPAGLAAFWSVVLGYTDKPAPAGCDTWADYDAALGVSADDAASGCHLVDPAGVQPRLYFQRVPEGKTAKNRVHLDICVTDVESAVSAAVRAGGTVFFRSPDAADPFVALSDPEGNEFCVVTFL